MLFTAPGSRNAPERDCSSVRCVRCTHAVVPLPVRHHHPLSCRRELYCSAARCQHALARVRAVVLWFCLLCFDAMAQQQQPAAPPPPPPPQPPMAPSQGTPGPEYESDDRALRLLESDLAGLSARRSGRMLTAFGSRQDEVLRAFDSLRELQTRFCLAQLESDLPPSADQPLNEAGADGKAARMIFENVDDLLKKREDAVLRLTDGLRELTTEVDRVHTSLIRATAGSLSPAAQATAGTVATAPGPAVPPTVSTPVPPFPGSGTVPAPGAASAPSRTF